VLGGVIGNRQHALKPMCIMCATKYGNSAGGIYAPRRVCVPLDDPPIPLYLVQKDELLIPAKHNTSRDEEENEATRLRGGRKDGDINLLEELQVAQQLGGMGQEIPSVRITLARKEEPSSWVLLPSDDADPALRKLQDELIPVRWASPHAVLCCRCAPSAHL
jgi:hypothetical protein